MQLELRPEDVVLLQRILSGYLSDLRMEIAGTDSAEWRREMKLDEERLGSLLDRLQQASRTATS